MFDGVKLLSDFLEKKYKLDPSKISEIKLTEIIKPFEDKNSVTILDLYNHVSNLYNKGNFNETVIQEISNESNQTLHDVLKVGDETKPFGKIGDITINQLANKMNDLNWEAISGNMKATVHFAPTALGLISYGFVLKAYLNSVHNKAVPQGLKGRDLINFNKAKHNRLLIFSTIWAPLIVVGIRTLSPGNFKNAVDIEILTSDSTSDSSGINKSGLMLVLGKMRDTYIKYIPENLRVIIK